MEAARAALRSAMSQAIASAASPDVTWSAVVRVRGLLMSRLGAGRLSVLLGAAHDGQSNRGLYSLACRSIVTECASS